MTTGNMFIVSRGLEQMEVRKHLISQAQDLAEFRSILRTRTRVAAAEALWKGFVGAEAVL